MRPWQALLDVAPLDLEPKRYEALLQAYSQPPRAYHNFDHVIDVANHWHDIDSRLGWARRRDTFAALLYHDAVYVAGSSDNETKSAAFARDELSGRDDVDLTYIARLIMLTARHGRVAAGEVDREEALFLDCDMAILGAPPDRFSAYDRAIREEYGAIPDVLYRAGRQRFLQRLLASPRIFLSGDFHRRFEAQARINLLAAVGR